MGGGGNNQGEWPDRTIGNLLHLSPNDRWAKGKKEKEQPPYLERVSKESVSESEPVPL